MSLTIKSNIKRGASIGLESLIDSGNGYSISKLPKDIASNSALDIMDIQINQYPNTPTTITFTTNNLNRIIVNKETFFKRLKEVFGLELPPEKTDVDALKQNILKRFEDIEKTKPIGSIRIPQETIHYNLHTGENTTYINAFSKEVPYIGTKMIGDVMHYIVQHDSLSYLIRHHDIDGVL